MIIAVITGIFDSALSSDLNILNLNIYIIGLLLLDSSIIISSIIYASKETIDLMKAENFVEELNLLENEINSLVSDQSKLNLIDKSSKKSLRI